MVNLVMNSHSLLRFFSRWATAGLIVALTACGGGGGGGGSTTTSPSNPASYTVSAVAGAGTTISPASLTVASGQTASFTVGMLPGYSNLVVTGGGGTLSGTTYTTGPITANTTVTASATAILTHTVTIALGTGVHTPSTSITVNDGASVTIPFTLDAGYTNLVVTGGTGTLSGLSYSLTNVTANVALNASATAPVVAHTVSVTLATGVHTPSTSITVNDGGSVTIPFTLDANYTNLVVSGSNGTLSGLTYTLTNVTADVTLTASATAPPPPPVTHTITIVTGTGVHTPANVLTVNNGSNVSIPFTLDANYTNLVVSGSNGTLSGLTYTLTNVTADVTLTASATAPPPTHTVTIVAGKGILPLQNSSLSVTDGGTVSFVYTIDLGYRDPVVTGLGSTTYLQSVRNYVCSSAPVYQDGQIDISATVDDRYALQYIRSSDNVLFSNEFNTKPITLEVRATGTGFTIYAEYLAVKEQLYDDGSHGDRLAGDGIYTTVLTLSSPLPSPLRYHDHTVDWMRLDIYAYDANGSRLLSVVDMSTDINIGIVDVAQTAASTLVSNDIYAAPNMLNVVIPTLCDGNNHELEVLQKIYQLYPDMFDSIALLFVGNTRAYNGFTGNWPHTERVKVIETGLGIAPEDLTSYYGSAGQLQSVISLDNDIAGFSFLHEFAHRWGFYLNDSRLKLSDGSNVHITAPTTLLGQLSTGYYLAEQSNGDFLVTDGPDGSFSPGNKYADWELYLMGYLDPPVVGAERFVLDPTVVQSYGTIIPRASTDLIPLGGIPGSRSVVGIYGTRVPDAAGSQHAFKVLFVAVSDRPLTLAETSLVNRDATYFASHIEGRDPLTTWRTDLVSMPTFWSATKYLGTMDTTVPSPVPPTAPRSLRQPSSHDLTLRRAIPSNAPAGTPLIPGRARRRAAVPFLDMSVSDVPSTPIRPRSRALTPPSAPAPR